MGDGELESFHSQDLSGQQKKRSSVCVGRGHGYFLGMGPDAETVGSDPNAGFFIFCRVMKLEAGCGRAASEVLRLKKRLSQILSHAQRCGHRRPEPNPSLVQGLRLRTRPPGGQVRA